MRKVVRSCLSSSVLVSLLFSSLLSSSVLFFFRDHTTFEREVERVRQDGGLVFWLGDKGLHLE
jgi:hypothetical protein